MANTLQIRVSLKSVYGNETLYPACPVSAFFCALAGTKTLTPVMVQLIRTQGYDIAIETPRVTFR